MAAKPFKPRNRAHHEALLASGEVRPVTIQAPKVFRHVASDDCYGQTETDGEFVTGYLALMLDEAPGYRLRKAGPKFLRDLGRGARGILAVLSSPVAGVLAVKFGLNLGPARAITSALSQSGPAAQARALVDLWGSERLREVVAELERRLEAGELSPDDAAAVVAVGLGVKG